MVLDAASAIRQAFLLGGEGVPKLHDFFAYVEHSELALPHPHGRHQVRHRQEVGIDS